jgi:glycosyltransferase involved in cell wall biosynthesis
MAGSMELHRFVFRYRPALIYVNSIASANAVETLAPGVPMVTHVHELQYAFSVQTGPCLSQLLAETRHFIACSNAVRENLMSNHAVPASRIETIHASIPVGDVRPERTREEVLRELHIPEDALLVIGSGSAGWGKGTDLFIQLARAVCRQRSRVYFVWLGACPRDGTYFEHDLRVAGLAEKARFTGAVLNPADYLAAGDIFVVTSREDSYPVVCLEAAAMAKPIVCFADAGGTPEFVEDDCGFVVPYLDIMAMAERVVHLLDSSQCRLKMGTAARKKVMQRHDVSKAGPRIVQVIERVIGAGEQAI